MKKQSLLFAFLFLALASFAQDKFIQVTTVESIIPGGLGRSKMIITKEDGTQTESDLENLYSMVGINFGNIKQNDVAVLTKINNLLGDGYELMYVNTGVQSPADNKGGGIYMTRYLLRKKK